MKELLRDPETGKAIFFSFLIRVSQYCRLGRWKFEMIVAPVLPDTFGCLICRSSVIFEHLGLHLWRRRPSGSCFRPHLFSVEQAPLVSL